jgi:transcriptional regulator with XRE-family HTH domain
MASLDRTAVGQLERGERVGRVDTLIKLAGSLGIPPDELLDGMGWDPGADCPVQLRWRGQRFTRRRGADGP